MTTDVNTNPSNAPSTFPPRTSEVPTKPPTTGTGNEDRAEKTADHMAHKGAKTEQDFDKDNSQLFTK
jgi:hypothetical protein